MLTTKPRPASRPGDALTFCHLSDCHLGYFRRRGEETRTRDFGHAFHRALESAARLRPDFVMVTGDLFHRPNPVPLGWKHFVTGCQRYLRPRRIPLYLSAGNHEVRRSYGANRPGETIYDVIQLLGLGTFLDDAVHVHETADGTRQALLLGLRAHGTDTARQFQAVVRENRAVFQGACRDLPRVALLHCLTSGMGFRVHDVHDETLAEIGGFHYYGTGHWHHRYENARCGIFCPGATEHTSPMDWNNEPGFYHVTMPRETGWLPRARFVPLGNTRPKLRVPLHFTRAPRATVYQRLVAAMRAHDVPGALVLYELTGTTATSRAPVALPEAAFRRFQRRVLSFRIRNRLKSGAPGKTGALPGLETPERPATRQKTLLGSLPPRTRP